MKLVMLSHLASTSAPTGAEWVLELLARELSGCQHQVAVSAPGTWALTSRLEEAGVEAHEVQLPSEVAAPADSDGL